ncbi:probable E3 ubiquitin-protein ligase RHG1A isoform X1 [Vigna radiata var. radiata]|uniref:Probable E3 ubiquitin-protein ligase RHG1A isoform X1 n=2 Tax=Vigna radiata var. radiata TaxID=3916 RepID=A0A1S3UX88_VIGRR|nr:probable E3 ubiquitin-protein ligase RHG1A isoform X1 [Vigna radiata var. radiata]
MGSNGSKATPSSSGSLRKGRSTGLRVFQSYCLGTTSGSHDSDNAHQACDKDKVNGSDVTYANGNLTKSYEVKTESFTKVKASEIACMPSNIDLHEWGETSIPNTSSRTASSSSHNSSTHSLNPTSHFLSQLSLIPGSVSFRLSRTTSLGSSRPCPVSSASLSIIDNEDECNLHPRSPGSSINRREALQGNDLLHASVFNQIHVQSYEDASSNLRSSVLTSGTLGNLQRNPTDGVPTREGLDVNLFSPRIQTETEIDDTRNIDQRNGARESVEQNVHFSRTLSVGRLHDRVLRRTTFSDLTFFPLQQEREPRDDSHHSQDIDRQPAEGDSRVSSSDHMTVNSSTSSMSNSMFGIQDYEDETSRLREGRHQDLLEHRSNFLERRRRMRSQVRALQRLGSRFENLSGHDRSCILSGQHRNGHCTCRINNRNTNSNDDTGARASISRIVMLAEALFEVLDEIHQQSVVLSSRPSVSSSGSVPAPNDVVDSLPVKLYEKLHKHQEDGAQCYICLVEYEDGDNMRVLPCHHEFHRTCIDKWLKQIHRVCPLCRGDICISDSTPSENKSV